MQLDSAYGQDCFLIWSQAVLKRFFKFDLPDAEGLAPAPIFMVKEIEARRGLATEPRLCGFYIVEPGLSPKR